MKGLMQDWPLLVHRVLDHASHWHGEREIISRTVEGPTHRQTYRDLDRRSRALASAAQARLGIENGDIIATMAWNGYRHMEIWYGIMGLGAIVHTLNPRLFADQLTYIINHAQDRWIFIDLSFVALFEKLQLNLPSLQGFVIMTDAAHMPENTTLKNPLCYEDLLASGDDAFAWPELDENTACGLCYTSGTTGKPKGVLYSHRSNVLHGLGVTTADGLAISSRDTVLPVVPMFHANAWGLVHASPMTGADIVMPGPKLDGASVYELLVNEKVTMSAAVPTIWFMLLQHLEANPQLALPDLNRVAIGGSSCPESLMRAFKEKYQVDVIHAWGMTETSPIATVCRPIEKNMSEDAQWKQRVKQGRALFGVEMKLADDEGKELPHNGKAFGRLKVKGPWISAAYFRDGRTDAFDDGGWFDTGDVSTIDPSGYMQITDRSKDVIKSGGEWISSIELENAAVSCAGVAEAAAIGLPHPKWDERPLLIIVKKPGANVSKEQVLAHLAGKVAKWWLPDDVAFAGEIPHTATGKISKLQLREKFKDYRLPTL